MLQRIAAVVENLMGIRCEELAATVMIVIVVTPIHDSMMVIMTRIASAAHRRNKVAGVRFGFALGGKSGEDELGPDAGVEVLAGGAKVCGGQIEERSIAGDVENMPRAQLLVLLLQMHIVLLLLL